MLELYLPQSLGTLFSPQHCWASDISVFHSQPCSSLVACLYTVQLSPPYSLRILTGIPALSLHNFFLSNSLLTDISPFSCLKFCSLPPQLGRTTIIFLGFSFLCHGWKILPKQRTAWSQAHFMSFSSVRDHSVALPVVHCLKTVVSRIL